MDLRTKTDAECDICKHKDEETEASNVCKQCRMFLCQPCSSKHSILPSFRDHLLIKLTGMAMEGTTCSPASTSSTQGSVSMIQIASSTGGSTVVDSDFECSGGLSALFNAPGNYTLNMVSVYVSGVYQSYGLRNIFCLSDDRFCIHSGDKIAVFSKECTRQFDIECSMECSVIHIEGSEIAILNSYLYIDRYLVGKRAETLVDTIKIEYPKESETASVFGAYSPFAYNDGHYVIFFGRSDVYTCEYWCIFNIAGRLLRQIPFKYDIMSSGCKLYASHFRQCCDVYLVLSNEYDGYNKLCRVNRLGNIKTIYETDEPCMTLLYFDGEFILSLSKRQVLTIEELATKMRRSFDISFSEEIKYFLAVQKNQNRILIFSRDKVIVFGLHKQ